MMKNLLLFFLFALSVQVKAQFQGSVEYAITYQALQESEEALLEMLPAKATLYLKEEKSLFIQDMGGGAIQAFSSDARDGSSILMMQFMGKGYMVKMSEEQMNSLKEAEKLEIKDTDSFKKVAGFTCQKAFAISGQDKLEVYYSKDFQLGTKFPMFDNLKGLPLEYEMIRGGVKMKFTATAVNEGPLDDSIFIPAKGLISMTFEQFATSFAVKL
jgi:GLPGLI family protein